jgi:tetratricopeptide (TPR) repeat protein
MSLTLAALALSVLLVASGQDAPDDPALTEARRLINAGEPLKAVPSLQAIRADAPPDRRARIDLVLGVAYYHADDPARTVETLMPIVDRFPSGSLERREADQVLGLSLFVTGRYADAVPRLEATRQWATGNLDLAYALGRAYIQTQRPDDARRCLAEVFGVAPDSAAAHLVTAQTMIRLEAVPEAEKELARAVAIDPKLPGANLLLGQLALFRGRFEEAAVLTQRELAINPANAMAFSQLGDALVRQSKWDEAIAALRRSTWINPYYSAPYILLGRAYAKKDQPAAAEAMLRQAIDYDPNNRTAHYQLAQLLQQQGRAEEAAREFEMAEKLSRPAAK